MIELVCIITGFYPAEVTVDWLVNGQSGLLEPITERPTKDAKRYTFSTTSTVNVSQDDWLAEKVFICQVTHSGTQRKVKSETQKCEGRNTLSLRLVAFGQVAID